MVNIRSLEKQAFDVELETRSLYCGSLRSNYGFPGIIEEWVKAFPGISYGKEESKCFKEMMDVMMSARECFEKIKILEQSRKTRDERLALLQTHIEYVKDVLREWKNRY